MKKKRQEKKGHRKEQKKYREDTIREKCDNVDNRNGTNEAKKVKQR